MTQQYSFKSTHHGRKGYGFFMATVGLLTSISVQADASEFGCMLRPLQTVEVRSPVVGRLAAIHVDRGSYVKKGQVIARLDTSAEQATANAAKHRATMTAPSIAAQNKIKAAQAKVDRIQILYEANYMSAQALDDAKNELSVAQAELLAAQENKAQANYEYQTSMTEISRRVITSPLSGTVTARYVDTGSVVSPTDGKFPIMTIAQTDRLKVQVIAPVKYFNQIRQGSRLTITPEAPFNHPISMMVAIKDRSVDAASGTFSMIGYISNPNNRIPSGVLCSAGL